MTSRYPAISADITNLFAARDPHAAAVAVLQPADPFLDMAGEDLRRRIFLTDSETGQILQSPKLCQRHRTVAGRVWLLPAGDFLPLQKCYSSFLC